MVIYLSNFGILSMLLKGLRNGMKQVIKGHQELKYFVGMDVDSVAHDIAQPRLDAVLNAGVKAITVLRNFRDVKSVLREIAELHLLGVDAILMDLGMSSMQVHSTTLYVYPFFTYLHAHVPNSVLKHIASHLQTYRDASNPCFFVLCHFHALNLKASSTASTYHI